MRIKITSDSTCDLSANILEQSDISIISLHLEKDGALFLDGLDIRPEDIFNHVNNGGEMCTTSAVNPAEYIAFFEQFMKEYDAVIHINLGSGFSSCYNNACIAAEEYNNVYVVDSMNLSTGQGHVVMEAVKKAKDASSVEEVLAHLNHIIPRVRASFLLDRLDYMAKGGRCSSVLALGANLLKLKPCIEVENGKMKLGKKYRGSLQKCLVQYVNDKLANADHIVKDRVFITHTTIDQQTVELVRDTINQNISFDKEYETEAGCTISAHCGQNTLGVLFIEN